MRRIAVIMLATIVGLATVAHAYDIQVTCGPGLRVFLDDTFVGLSSVKEDGLFLTNVPKGIHTIRVEKDGFEPRKFQVEIGLPVEVKVGDLVPVPEPTPEAAPAPASETARAATGPIDATSLEQSPPTTEAVVEEPPEPAVDAATEATEPAATSSAGTTDPPQAPAVKPTSDKGEGLLGTLNVTSAPQNCDVEIAGRKLTKSTPLLTISDLLPGEHTITFSKHGYEPISGKVVIRAGGEVSVRGNLQGGIVEVGPGGKGSLRIISEPARCTVYFGGKVHQKSYGRLNLSHIPAGRYALVVAKGGRRLSAMVEIVEGERTIVEVSFMRREKPFVVTRELE
jgi:hypothetical protein